MSNFSYLPDNATTPATTPQAAPRPRQQLGSACEECRRKKSRCDRQQPTCGACLNAGIVCIMRNSCPPRGPKKGHLRELRSQIAALEARLNDHENGNSEQTDENKSDEDTDVRNSASTSTLKSTLPSDFSEIHVSTTPISRPMSLVPLVNVDTTMISPLQDAMSIGANLSPLVCTDLDQLYFDRVHQFCPMMQKFRYLSWSKQLGRSRQQICLQYTMWILAASLSSQFQLIRDQLYKEVRQLLDALDMDTAESGKRSLEQVQAWALLSIYEFISDDYQRGLVSAGRAFRLTQLLKLHEVDGGNVTTSDWINTESMRRTFWVVYTIDCFTSINERLPLTFHEHMIATRLPAPDAHFMSGRPITMSYLSEAMASVESDHGPDSPMKLTISSFANSVIIGTICGRTLIHRQKSAGIQPSAEKSGEEFCFRHQALDKMLAVQIKHLSVQVSASDEPNPMLVFVIMNAYMMVLILYEVIETVTSESTRPLLLEYKQQSLEAARELGSLATVLTRLSHFQIHPFAPIPLLLSARFCQAHHGACTTYDTLMGMIQPALQGLCNVNSLAKNGLRLLGLDPLPTTTDWSPFGTHWDTINWDDSTVQ
ncbi:hypothetical protein S7711_09364 [Stachybotrys chartarum IBT 7711]|uniref:Zn(2)-C6 fungal-type domain-containing protein n=1 Tax=Stachybotrys chartarum (strain CBS 109288 / IBT 7711) TaxID=1280523 RepID=A0A084AYL0_STACB|nr:hypothetical protein S7711_09364 [Stachybotrys chartarum IBT 7711]KFA50986.1 hypothetical protein S40293_07249 [Stachybotrys chartarum IBT 40293]